MDCLLPRPCDLCRRDIERERIERSMSLEEEAEYDRQVDSPPLPQLETDRTQRCNFLVSGTRGHASGDIMVLIKRVRSQAQQSNAELQRIMPKLDALRASSPRG